MTITMVQPMAIGNALKIFLAPSASAVLWRVLRTVALPFVDENDPNAWIVYQGNQERFRIDATGLMNGTPYSYCCFEYDGTSWTPSAVVTATPNATYDDQTTDVLTVVRDRLDVGLQVEVGRGTLTPQDGAIAVLNAPPEFDDTRWPVVTVQVVTDGSGDRAVGEAISLDELDPATDLFIDAEGWWAHVELAVIGWSKNPDERIALRKVLRRLVIGNLAVFDAAGLLQIGFNQTDVNEMSQSPPIYASEGRFVCLAPAAVRSEVDQVTDVTSTAIPDFPHP
jgi:hypothetical protein